MKAVLAVLAPCLCQLRASATGLYALDQGCLIQRSTMLEDTQKLEGDAHGSLLLPAFAKQVPGMEDMLASNNMTMQDVMSIAQQVLMSLKEQDFVDLLNSTLNDIMVVAGDWIKAGLTRIAALKANSNSLTSEEDSYELLSSFYKQERKEALQLADVALDKLKTLKDGLPANLTALFDRMGSNATDGLGELIKTSLTGLFDGVANSTNTTLCKELRPAMEKTKVADDMVNGQILPMFAQVRSMMPSIGPMVGMLVPEVADTVTDLANSTVERVEPILTSFGEAFHSEVWTVSNIATVHSHCSFSSGGVRSGPCLPLLVVALAAWMSLRA